MTVQLINKMNDDSVNDKMNLGSVNYRPEIEQKRDPTPGTAPPTYR